MFLNKHQCIAQPPLLLNHFLQTVHCTASACSLSGLFRSIKHLCQSVSLFFLKHHPYSTVFSNLDRLLSAARSMIGSMNLSSLLCLPLNAHSKSHKSNHCPFYVQIVYPEKVASPLQQNKPAWGMPSGAIRQCPIYVTQKNPCFPKWI